MHNIGKYKIDIYQEHTFTRGSADNVVSYDFEYFTDSIYSPTTVFGIQLFEDEELLDSVVIGASGGATVYHENAVVFEEDRVLIGCSDTIFCLSIPDLVLIWQVKVDMLTCFKIFKYHDRYIVHGEITISCLGKNGNIIWQQWGADIFVTLDDEPDFWLEEDYIFARDFSNRIYQFDYHGKVINNSD